MVDDRTQRPFGSTEPARSAPKTGGSSGSDPLAELARLIGQSDPFGEFGAGARRASAPPAHEPPQAWIDVPQAGNEPPSSQPTQDFFGSPSGAPSVLPPNFANQSFGKQAFGSSAPNDDLYQVEGSAPAYGTPAESDYERNPYQQAGPQAGPGQDDYYEEEPPSRKRLGIIVIAGIFALAVIGTAGAFGYRALFGGSSASVPPPVIKADATPSKVVPAAAKDPQTNKQITDRVNDKAPGERLVSREEQPVAVTPQPDAAPPQAAAPPPPAAAAPVAAPAPGVGSGVVGGAEPKKVRTIAIRPDQGTPEAAPQPPPPAALAAAPAPAAAPAQAAAAPAAAPPAQAAPVRVIPTARPAAPARPAASANAPLSLNPNDTPSEAPARPAAPAPARTAAVAPPAAASGGGGYMVQVSSQRSEAEAQSAFATLQGKYPGQLGGKQAVIRKVELAGKGTYYRAMVPAGDSAEATRMCSGIKAAGGSCLVQKN